MSKVIAKLPDFMGDDWDPFVLEMATKILEIEADRERESFQIDLQSLIFTKPVYLTYKATPGGPKTTLWISATERNNIPVANITAIYKQEWEEGSQKDKYAYFSKVHKETKVPTYIPRDLVPILKFLKVIPLPKKK